VLWADAVPMTDKSAIAATDAKRCVEIFRDICFPPRKINGAFHSLEDPATDERAANGLSPFMLQCERQGFAAGFSLCRLQMLRQEFHLPFGFAARIVSPASMCAPGRKRSSYGFPALGSAPVNCILFWK
jgi:hypothetical protein